MLHCFREIVCVCVCMCECVREGLNFLMLGFFPIKKTDVPASALKKSINQKNEPIGCCHGERRRGCREQP